MLVPSAALCEGTPHFRSPHLEQRAREQGVAAAWADALAGPVAQAVDEVDGDFAVALQEASGRTILAVDRMGIRTLCYRVDGDRIRFARRADELADPGQGIDPQSVFAYLYFHVIPSPATVYPNVFRLPPGHVAIFEGGRLEVRPYWSARFDERAPEDFQRLKAEFLDILRQSALRQLDGTMAACFLSGGTDSSTVAGMVGRVSGQAPSTYSIGFDAQGYDEMAYARIAARHFGTRHHEYYVTPDDLARSIPSVAAHYDQPFGNSSALPAYYCAKMARDDGVTRILAGDGGDELFGGNSRYAKQRVFDAYRHVPGVLRSGLIEPLVERTPIRSTALGRKAASYLEQARMPMPDRLGLYNLLLRLGPGEVLTREFLAGVNQGGPLRAQQLVWQQAQCDSDLNRNLAFDWRYTLAENDLPKVCLTTELAGLSVGFPLLDRELLEFSMRLPVSYKLRGTRLRWFFKEALRGFLPDEIITKTKHGFGLPFGVWAQQHQALRALASDSLRSFGTRGVVQPAFIEALFDRHLPAHPGYYGEMVWILMMLEQWLRHHAPDWRLP